MLYHVIMYHIYININIPMRFHDLATDLPKPSLFELRLLSLWMASTCGQPYSKISRPSEVRSTPAIRSPAVEIWTFYYHHLLRLTTI